MLSIATKLKVASAMLLSVSSTLSASERCTATSAATQTPVVELYTSEGCSSCPPADRWASSLKGKGLVVQAFHVGYWDYIGWVDRFAAPAYTQRQRDIANRNRQRNVYTPQAVVDGQDWSEWHAGGGLPASIQPEKIAKVAIRVQQLGADQFEASVTPLPSVPGALRWSAYWTLTEHGHNSKVQSGENAGEVLKHDFVVRQYTPAGDYDSRDGAAQKLLFRSIAATPGHPRQINLVVFDPRTGSTLQALSLQCSA